MLFRTIVPAIAMTFALPAFAGDEGAEKKGPPFGEAPKAAQEAAPKPAERQWTVKAGDFEIAVSMKPGIPDPDQMTEVMITANAIPKTPHPRYGSRVPQENANITVELTNPAGETVAKYLAHAMPLASGKYGIHVTPRQEGIYTLAVRGKSEDGKSISGDIKLPVKVWPLPAELQGSGDSSDKGQRKPIKL